MEITAQTSWTSTIHWSVYPLNQSQFSFCNDANVLTHLVQCFTRTIDTSATTSIPPWKQLETLLFFSHPFVLWICSIRDIESTFCAVESPDSPFVLRLACPLSMHLGSCAWLHLYRQALYFSLFSLIMYSINRALHEYLQVLDESNTRSTQISLFFPTHSISVLFYN